MRSKKGFGCFCITPLHILQCNWDSISNEGILFKLNNDTLQSNSKYTNKTIIWDKTVFSRDEGLFGLRFS